MSELASHILRIAATVALLVSASAMSWMQTADDPSAAQSHDGGIIAHQMVAHGTTDHETERHHDALCAAACSVGFTPLEPLTLDIPLSLTLRSAPHDDLTQTSLAPEPRRRPPKFHPILV